MDTQEAKEEKFIWKLYFWGNFGILLMTRLGLLLGSFCKQEYALFFNWIIQTLPFFNFMMSLKSSVMIHETFGSRLFFKESPSYYFLVTPLEGLDDYHAKWKVHRVSSFLPLPQTPFITSARHTFNFSDIFLITQGLSSILANFPLI